MAAGTGGSPDRPDWSEVRAFYSGRSVLVTGATGQLGKVLVEKLMWAVPDIGEVFLLVRPKRGLTQSERLRAILDLPLFARVRSQCPGQLAKLRVVAGDVEVADLGLSAADRSQLLPRTSVVFHCAASQRLRGCLKQALNLNTRGTQRALQLAQDMPSLQMFVHVSSAFCHGDLDELGERTYPPPHHPEDMMGCADLLDEAAMQQLTARLLNSDGVGCDSARPHPNIYTYSKRLAEDLVARSFPRLPVCIVRPSIVTPSWEEPCPGWVDSLNGPVGVLAGAGKGVIRSMYCIREYRAEIIPLDFVVNAILVAAFRLATAPRAANVPVLNLAAGKWRSETWADILEVGRRAACRYPFEKMIWYPGGDIRSSQAVHDGVAFFLHCVPAYFIDFLMLLFRQPRFMVRVYRRIAEGLDLLQYFTTRQWVFHNEGFVQLWHGLGPCDKRLFNFDLDVVELDEYMARCVLGAREYCLKEPPASIPRQRRLLRAYYAAHLLVVALLWAVLGWLAFRWCFLARSFLESTSVVMVGLPLLRTLVADEVIR